MSHSKTCFPWHGASLLTKGGDGGSELCFCYHKDSHTHMSDVDGYGRSPLLGTWICTTSHFSCQMQIPERLGSAFLAESLDLAIWVPLLRLNAALGSDHTFNFDPVHGSNNSEKAEKLFFSRHQGTRFTSLLY